MQSNPVANKESQVTFRDVHHPSLAGASQAGLYSTVVRRMQGGSDFGADRMTTLPSSIPAAYHRDIERAVEISREEGCREIFVFGSVVAGTPGVRSDLDLAVRGCPPERFYRLLGRLMEELLVPVDLIDLDVESSVADYLEKEGQLVHVG